MLKKWTQLDQRFWNNWGSGDLRIFLKNGVNYIKKSWRKYIQNALKLSDDRFWPNIRPTLGHIISGTKCDRDKPMLGII